MRLKKFKTFAVTVGALLSHDKQSKITSLLRLLMLNHCRDTNGRRP
jgi:hypothetical protein